MLHDNLTQANITCRGLIGISNNTTVNNGTTLTFEANSKVYLLNGGNLIVEAGANLVIKSGVQFIKDNSGTANRIEVKGTLTSCNNISFFSGAGNNKLNVVLNKASTTSFEQCNFTNCALIGNNGYLTIDECDFISSTVSYDLSTFASNNLIYVTNSNFTGNGSETAIHFEGAKKWVIQYNVISNYLNGVGIFNSKTSNTHIFGGNTINNCVGSGLQVYNSKATVNHNIITYNGIGVDCSDNSVVYMSGNCSSTDVSQTQQISFNSNKQVYAKGVFPVLFKYNAIEANNNSVRVLCDDCPSSTTNIIEKNFWGQGIVANQVSGFVSPSVLFDWNPIWPLGYDCIGGGGGESDMLKAADSTYQLGISYAEGENFETAKNVFSSVIEEYPATVYAQSALSELYYLEGSAGENFNSLKEYYETNPTIANDTSLQKAASFNANRCDIEMSNYSEAIDWFENVIENPDNFNDSIFAIIDLEYTYLLAEEDSTKSCPVGRYEEYKPRSQPEFIEYRDYLLSLVNQEKQGVKNGDSNLNLPQLNLLVQIRQMNL